MKYVHIIINISYTAPYIKLVNENFQLSEHLFFVVGGWSEDILKITKSQNVVPITKLSNLGNGVRMIYEMNRCRKVIFHGLFSPFLLWLLFLQPWLLKKSNWVIWGGDLYDYQKKKTSLISKIHESLRRFCILRFSELTTVIKGDFDLAKKWYKSKGILKRAMYSTPLNTLEIDRIVESIPRIYEGTLNIQIGNSASVENNHFEILDLLEKYKGENILIFALLSYGDKDYGDKVIAYGRSLFGSKFIGITNYMDFSDFVGFMNSMDVIIFNHERQQAFGNLLLGIYLKKKIFMNSASTIWDLVNEQFDIELNKTQDISLFNFTVLADRELDTLLKNQRNVTTILSNSHIVKMWHSVFDS